MKSLVGISYGFVFITFLMVFRVLETKAVIMLMEDNPFGQMFMFIIAGFAAFGFVAVVNMGIVKFREQRIR